VPLGPEAIATSFRQGWRNLAKVQAVLAALARMGFVSAGDGGKTFLLTLELPKFPSRIDLYVALT
jgi:hypothetical protein